MRRPAIAWWVLVLALLLPAALLSVVRLLEPSSGWAIRLVAFTPLALPLYAAALLLLGIALLHRRDRTVLMGPLLVAMVGLGLHAWWFSPQVLGADPSAARGAEPVTVMTANLMAGRGDAISLMAEASDAGVDILVVEEITPGSLADMERVGLKDVMPYRVGNPVDGVEGTMVFSREPMGEPTRLRTVYGSWEVTVDDLTVFGVHAFAPVSPDAWRDDHAAILSAAVDAQPDLIIGDFNATADHEPMQALADAGFRDAAELANEGWQPTWPANGLYSLLGIPLPTTARIDHVLVASSLAVLGTRTVLLEGTDHRALIAEVAAVPAP